MPTYNFGIRASNFTKLFHVTSRKVGMIIWVKLFWGTNLTALKFGRAKTIENSALFWTTSDFDPKYPRNG